MSSHPVHPTASVLLRGTFYNYLLECTSKYEKQIREQEGRGGESKEADSLASFLPSESSRAPALTSADKKDPEQVPASWQAGAMQNLPTETSATSLPPSKPYRASFLDGVSPRNQGRAQDLLRDLQELPSDAISWSDSGALSLSGRQVGNLHNLLKLPFEGSLRYVRPGLKDFFTFLRENGLSYYITNPSRLGRPRASRRPRSGRDKGQSEQLEGAGAEVKVANETGNKGDGPVGGQEKVGSPTHDASDVARASLAHGESSIAKGEEEKTHEEKEINNDSEDPESESGSDDEELDLDPSLEWYRLSYLERWMQAR